MTLRLVVLVLLLCLPALAQDPIRQRIEQRLAESEQFFKQGDYNMGANRTDEAAQMVQSRPEAYPQATGVELAAKAVDYLAHESAEATRHGDEGASQKALLAEHSLLRSLCMWDSRNPKWFFMRGLVYAKRGDPASVRMAMRDFDMVSSLPGNGAYLGPSKDMRAALQQKVSQQASSSGFKVSDYTVNGPNGIKLQRNKNQWGPGLGRARVDWSKLPIPRGGSSGEDSIGTQKSYCTVCGRMHAPGDCTYRRD